MPFQDTTGRLIRKIETLIELTVAEREALTRLHLATKNVPADTDLVREKDRPTRSCLLLDGYLFRYKLVASGERQIVSVHVPGDIPDIQSLFLSEMDHGIASSTDCRVGYIEHEELRALFRAHPRLGDTFWLETLMDGSIYREWLASIGGRDAYSRIAHLLCEIICRLEAVGLSDGRTLTTPLAQFELAEATGISTVHVNRVLQRLKAESIVNYGRHVVTVLDSEKLRAAGEFEPSYLHLHKLNPPNRTAHRA